MPSKIHPLFPITALVVLIFWGAKSLLFTGVDAPDAVSQEASSTLSKQLSAQPERSTHPQSSTRKPKKRRVDIAESADADKETSGGKTPSGDTENAKSGGQPAVQEFAPEQSESESNIGDERDAQPDEQLLTISGRVLTDTGVPLSGIEVVALARRLFGESANGRTKSVRVEKRAWSGRDGFFHFTRLEDGEYEIRNEPTDDQETVRRIVRAGVASADLVLAEMHEVWIHGIVRNSNGNPLANVRVSQSGGLGETAFTDDDGNYGLYISVGGRRRGYLLRFQHQDYETGRITLRDEEMRGVSDLWIDAELEKRSNQTVARVRGEVTGADGRPVSGAVATLRSARENRRYSTLTNSAGVFVFPEVTTSDDYRLLIQPQDSYKKYSEKQLQITEEGLDLAIVLDPLLTDSFAGRLVDLDGNPIPNLSLWLRSTDIPLQQPLQVRSDDAGYFFVAEAPRGALVLRTLSSPSLRVSIAQAPPDEELELPLDWGDFQLRGQVIDSQGNPISGSRLDLYWSLYEGNLSSSSVRSVMADASGFFQFTSLGPGTHVINVEAPGFQTTRLKENVSNRLDDLRVTLKEAWQ